jgi:hypothetical protein
MIPPFIACSLSDSGYFDEDGGRREASRGALPENDPE